VQLIRLRVSGFRCMGAESVELSRRLAVHAPHTAPGCLARIVLRQAGLDPDRDIHALVRPLGDYGMDLRWLHDGRIDAALGRRPLPDPHRRRGRRPPHIHPDDPAVQAVVRAHRRGLQVIHNEPTSRCSISRHSSADTPQTKPEPTTRHSSHRISPPTAKPTSTSAPPRSPRSPPNSASPPPSPQPSSTAPQPPHPRSPAPPVVIRAS
jgi:hypothetical protein